MIFGFHAPASATLTAIPGCLLLHPDLMAAMPALEALTSLGASRKREVALSVTRTEAGPDVAVEGAKPADAGMVAALGGLAAEHGLVRLAWNGEIVATLAPPVQRFGCARVAPPPGGFLQATAEGEAALAAFVRRAVEGAGRVVDLFAGAGTFSLPVAESAEVHAVESDAGALAALDAGWRGAEVLRRLTTERRDLFRRPLRSDELSGFEAVIIDPPRAGAEAQTRSLAEGGPPVVASVSCNPATFARDAAILFAGDCDIGPTTVVDQFRWSAHVEIAARFTRGRAS